MARKFESFIYFYASSLFKVLFLKKKLDILHRTIQKFRFVLKHVFFTLAIYFFDCLGQPIIFKPKW